MKNKVGTQAESSRLRDSGARPPMAPLWFAIPSGALFAVLRRLLQSFSLFHRRCELRFIPSDPIGNKTLLESARSAGRLLDQFANILPNRRDAGVKIC
jgi:hypothetical protein